MILVCLCAFFFLVALGNVLLWPAVGPRRREISQNSVSVLIPARNEESNIRGCLATVFAQGPVVREVLVYNDHSVDATGAILRELGLADPRLRAILTEQLPGGWCGKNFACHRLAREAQSEWLLFLDADARLEPAAIERMLSEVTTRNITLLSCWPRFCAGTIWEKLLMPMLNFVVFTLYPAPLSLVRRDASLGLAHGACILAHRATYQSIGGHELVRNEIFEDTRLAQKWRAEGHGSLCLDGRGVVRVRMYSGPRQIWLGFQKNFFPAFQHGFSFWLFLALHGAVFLLPFLTGNWRAAAIVLGTRGLLALRFGQPWWTILFHPFAELFTLALGVSSWWRCRTGRGVVWKDRVYRAG